MIHHPIIAIPKLLLLAGIIIVLALLHGRLPPDQFLFAVAISAVAFVALSIVVWRWAARALVNPESMLARATVLSDRAGAKEGFTASGRQYESLKARRGRALTRLGPSGTAMIDGQRVSVMTQGEYVDAQSDVEVVDVRGSRIVVRPVRDGA